MQFITGLFGDSGNSILTMLFALGAVLLLIVLGVWLLKFITNLSGNVARGRNRRLSVVDTLSIDQKRQLLIIRRDGVEHLVLIGGPQDVVIETGIPAEDLPATQPARRALPGATLRRTSEPRTSPPSNASAKPSRAAPPQVAPEAPETPPVQAAQTRSLRHTALLRPVAEEPSDRTEQNSEFSAFQPSDSAKQADTAEGSKGAALDETTRNEANRG